VPTSERPEQATPRAGRCAIVGRSNVGKSTLLNALVGQKLAIATPKPQTTRARILGVVVTSVPPAEIAFVDTPGLHAPRNALGRALVEEAKAALADCDVIVAMIDATAPENEEDVPVVEAALASGRPVVLALNKVDRLADKRALLPLIDATQQRFAGLAAIVPIAALRGKQVDRLLDEVRARLPEGAPAYEEGFLTDRPERFFVAELVRESVIASTRQEVPHSVAVVIEEMKEEEKLLRISAVVIVEKESQKKIVVGARGTMIKKIGTDARFAIERMLEKKVFLKLWVKVIENWTKDPAVVRRLTLEGAL